MLNSFESKKNWEIIGVSLLLSFILIFAALFLFDYVNVETKARTVVSGIRNEILQGDSRTLLQKLHIFVANDNFIGIEVSTGVSASRERTIWEAGILDLAYCLPIYANTKDHESVVSEIRFKYSLGPILRNTLVAILNLFLIILMILPKIKRKIALQIQEAETRKRVAEQYRLARQVAHDIRSPLTALEAAISGMEIMSPERKLLLEQAHGRIKSIAEDLLLQSKMMKQMPSREEFNVDSQVHFFDQFEINSSIKKILDEKTMAFSQIQFKLDSLNSQIFVAGQNLEFQRLFSNLLQNAIEAVGSTHSPLIDIGIRCYKNVVQVSIMDNGKGIPVDVVNRIGEEGFSYDKPDGNGLGVSSAKSKLAKWGGTLSLSSNLGAGTVVSINLLRASSSTKVIKEVQFNFRS